PAVHLFLGRIAGMKGQSDKAQEHYQKSLAVNNSYAPARLGLAELFLSKGRIADAGVEIRKALDANPNSILGRLLQATVDTFERKYAEAEKEFTALAKEYPDNADVHHRLGLYYGMRGLTKDAENSFARALELQPNSQEILQALVDLYSLQKQQDRAIQLINNT